jgi:hypothetical protein
MRLDQIGGGRVIRAFRKDGKMIPVGTNLSREDILDINPSNRTSLVGRFIDVWPQPDTAGFNASSATGKSAGQAGRSAGLEKHVVSLGFNKFLVIEGKKLTEKPVSREEAYALAGKRVPPSKRRGAKES